MTKSIVELRVMFERIQAGLDELQAGHGDTTAFNALAESFRALKALMHAAGVDHRVVDVVEARRTCEERADRSRRTAQIECMAARRRPTTRRRDGSANYLVTVTFANCHSIDPAAIKLDRLLDRLAEMGSYAMTAPPFTLSGQLTPVWEFRINTRLGRAEIAAAFAVLSEASVFSIERDRSYDEPVPDDDVARA